MAEQSYHSVFKARQKAGKSGIHIKKSHEGRLHAAAGVKQGEKIPLAKEEALKAHGTPAERKQANFAINARKWHH
jgi:hypothetical protein